jgi:predicted permease
MLLLLLAVCGNTANLLLARASARQREMAVRVAMGAGRWTIVSLLLAESMMLAFFGVALGVPLAMWGTNVLRAAGFIGAFPIRFQTGVDGAGLVFAVLLGIACGLIFGLAPAVQLARVKPQLSFRSGSGATGRSGLRNAFMGMEVALALVVLVAAGLFLKSFRETREIDPGFRREGVLLAAYDFTGRPVDASGSLDFARRLVEKLRAQPDVESAAIATSVPLDIHGLPARAFTLEGRARSDAVPDQALTNTVTPGYFELMRILLVVGSGFADLRDATAAPQAIVNEEFVRRYIGRDSDRAIGNAEAIGRHLETGGVRYSIVGVARNSLYDSFGEPPTPAIYFSYRDRPSRAGEIHVRTRNGNEQSLASELRRAVRDIDPELPIYDVRTLSEHVEKNLFFRRIPARMFVVLGPLLLILAAIGIFAVVAYAVSHRTTEIGIRLALGATPRRVVAQIVADAMSVIVMGAAAGLAIGYVLAITFVGRGAVSMAVWGGVPVLLLCVAAVACWLPARRATLVEPVIALRHE